MYMYSSWYVCQYPHVHYITHDTGRICYIHFNECLNIANTAFMDFCGPWVVTLCLAYRLHTMIILKHFIMSALGRCYKLYLLIDYKRISQDLVHQRLAYISVLHTNWLHNTVDLYTVPMHRSTVFHCNGELWYAVCENPLCALVSFTGAMKSKALTHKPMYAWCFQYHLPNGRIKCSGFHREEQQLLFTAWETQSRICHWGNWLHWEHQLRAVNLQKIIEIR